MNSISLLSGLTLLTSNIHSVLSGTCNYGITSSEEFLAFAADDSCQVFTDLSLELSCDGVSSTPTSIEYLQSSTCDASDSLSVIGPRNVYDGDCSSTDNSCNLVRVSIQSGCETPTGSTIDAVVTDGADGICNELSFNLDGGPRFALYNTIIDENSGDVSLVYTEYRPQGSIDVSSYDCSNDADIERTITLQNGCVDAGNEGMLLVSLELIGGSREPTEEPTQPPIVLA